MIHGARQSRRRALLGAAILSLLVAGALPASASAHGLVQRSSLPIPEWLFAWAAAIVLVISFVALSVLWPRPRLERPRWRPLPWGIGRILGSRSLEVAGGVIGMAVLLLLLAAGFEGPVTPLDNLAPTFILIVFWVGMVFLSVLFGDVFRLFNPWRALGRVLVRDQAARPYPEWLGRWPAAAGLLGFTWIELASGWGEKPALLATAALGYTVLTLVAMAVYGVEPWTRCGEAFSVYFNLFSRLSVFETRDRVVGLRPPLGGLPQLEPVPGTVASVCVMIGTVSFDGLSQGQLWANLAAELNDGVAALGVGLETTPKVVATLGLCIAVLLVSCFYALGISGARSVGGELGVERLREGFIHTLVPIATVYVAAHYLSFLLFEGQSIFYLISDPLGQGWDVFGTASSAIDYGLLSQNGIWYFQVAFVVLGHVGALILAHDRALVLYGDSRLAVRSQYWMLAVMVGFTSLALWLLAQAGK